MLKADPRRELVKPSSRLQGQDASARCTSRQGQAMIRYSSIQRSLSLRAMSALVFTGALLAPIAVSGAAQAQVLGYAATEPEPFPPGAATAPSEADNVLPERLRRAV